MLALIWIQTVHKDYQKKTLAYKELKMFLSMIFQFSWLFTFVPLIRPFITIIIIIIITMPRIQEFSSEDGEVGDHPAFMVYFKELYFYKVPGAGFNIFHGVSIF